MRVIVDQMKCGSVGRCVKRCPEVFRFQEGSKRAAVMLDPVPEAFRPACREAARLCPNGAIEIKEE